MSICIEAAEALEADGLATRVVSMPCFDRFSEQDEDYRDDGAAALVSRADFG